MEVSACDCIRFSTGAYKNVPERIDKHPSSTDTFGELGCSLTRFSTGAALQPVREYRILRSSGSSRIKHRLPNSVAFMLQPAGLTVCPEKSSRCVIMVLICFVFLVFVIRLVLLVIFIHLVLHV